MKLHSIRVLFFWVVVCAGAVAFSQQQSGEIPRVIRYDGTLKNVDGSPRAGTFGVMFSIYIDDKTTVALWQEVQNVVADGTGHYTVLLGGTTSAGLPDALFAANTARWLGIRVENEPEQPRVLLAAAPYALKAADAETLGGKPLSAFVLNEAAGTSGEAGTTGGKTSGSGSTSPRLHSNSLNTASTGTQGFLAKWTDNAGTLGNSIVTDNGAQVGIGKTPSLAALDVNGSVAATSFGGPSAFLAGASGIDATFNLAANAGPSTAIIGTAGAAGQLASGSAVGDLVIRSESKNILMSTDGGATDTVTVGNGQVGIGKAPSLALLDVNGTIAATSSGGPSIFLAGKPGNSATFNLAANGGPSTAIIGTAGGAGQLANGSAAGDLVVRSESRKILFTTDSGATQAVVVSNGSVGIGKTPSLATLDVNGGAAFTTVTATSFSGSGASLTNLPAGNLTGPIPNSALSGSYSNAVTLSNVSNSYAGNGSALTNVPAASVGGVPASIANLRLITYLGGCDSCSALTASDNQNLIYQNLLGSALTFQSITCYSDAGTPSINIQRDTGGGTANVTASAIPCSTSGSTVSSFSVTTVNANDKLNFLMTTPDGAAHRVTVIIKATL